MFDLLRGTRLKGFSLCITLWVSGVLAPTTVAQTSTGTVASFEVASIKPSKPDVRNSNLNFRPGRISTENVNLQNLIQFAYHLNSGSENELVGGPSWVRQQGFDIEAKEDDALAAKLEAMSSPEREEVIRTMVRSLLADRFGLKVHTETRERVVNALFVAKGGSKLQPFSDTPTSPGEVAASQGWQGLHGDGQGHIEGRGATLEMFVKMLGAQRDIGGRMVVDKTGLTGKYNFTLAWTPEPDGAGSGGEATGPSLFAALQEQLGLRLASIKAPVEVLVIDSVAQPSPN